MRFAVSLIASAVLSLGLMSPSWADAETKPDIQHASAIDATDPTSNYAVIAPIYTGNGSGPQSYIRLFSGAGYGGKTSTFTVTVVATPSGRSYGSFTVAIPYMASIQYSIQEIVQAAGAASLNGGDTGYSVYLKNSDPEAGYQHAIYDWTTELFENGSNCTTTINDQMLALHNRKVVTNVHTSAIANNTYPSTIYVHNYATTSKTYTMFLYNAGGRSSSGLNSDSGQYTCDLNITVPGNSTQSFPIVTLLSSLTSSDCALASDESYLNVAFEDTSGAPLAADFMHTIRVAKYNGNSNMSAVCAVNRRTATSLSASTTYQGTLVGQSGQTGTLSVTVAAGSGTTSAATGTYRLNGGTAVALTGTYTASTNGLTLTGGGYTFRGTVAGNTFLGAYSGSNNASGGFSTLNAASGVTTYCGSFGGGASGVFNMQISGTTLSGLALATDDTDPPTRFSATVSGSSISGRTSGDATISGTIAGQAINGTFVTLDNLSGTFSATACVVG